MSSYSRRSRTARSNSPQKGKRYASRSISSSRSRSRSRSRDSSVDNPGNNLYVTGMSTRVTRRDIEKHFSEEGKVEDVHLVVDPITRESRGFGFVTMSTLKEADRCVKYLNRSVLDGRVITVEKSRRCRGRTPTPGRYLGPQASAGGYGGSYRSERDRSNSPYYSSGEGDRRSYSPHYNRYGRSGSRSRLPYRTHRDSPYYYRSRRSVSPCYSPSPRRSRRSYSRGISPESSTYRRSSRRRSYSRSRSRSPDVYRERRRVYNDSPRPRRRRRSRSRSSPSPSPSSSFQSYSSKSSRSVSSSSR